MKKLTLTFASVLLLALICNLSSCVVVSHPAQDNGLHKGWTKNSNNPHHPNTTNPGHTKQKSKGKGR